MEKQAICTVVLVDGRCFDITPSGDLGPNEKPITILPQGMWPEIAKVFEGCAQILKATEGGN